MTGLRSPWADALADRYRVERELGRGGMAVVYLARDVKHDRPVALKVLRPELSAALGRDRFLREIQVTARLQHPHILPVFDSGESSGHLWYTMPYVEGETLRARVAREGRLPVDTGIQLAREVASALAYAHDAGVVHRDIKPENILLSRQGQALVADFGIAKALTSDETLTETGLALGTPSYMAPEQILGERPVRPQADVYALGVVLYEVLTGVRPFADSAPAAMLAKRLTDGAPLITAQRPEVPEAIAVLVRDTLEVDPARRPASGAALAARLAEASVQTAGVDGAVAAGSCTPGPVLDARRCQPGGRGAGGSRYCRGSVKRDEASIGVLPFENRSGDSAQAYLSEGVSDELTAQLSAVPELKVSPRSSTMRFRGSTEAPDAIARQLGVKYLLTGGVVRQGDTRAHERRTHRCPGEAPALEPGARRTRALAGRLRGQRGSRSVHGRLRLRRPVPRRASTSHAGLAGVQLLPAGRSTTGIVSPNRTCADRSRTATVRLRATPTFVNAWLARANALVCARVGHRQHHRTRGTGSAPTGAGHDPRAGSGVGAGPRDPRHRCTPGSSGTGMRPTESSARRSPSSANAALSIHRAAFLQAARGHTDSALALSATAQANGADQHPGLSAAQWAYYGRRYEQTPRHARRRALQLDPYFFAALAVSRRSRSAPLVGTRRPSRRHDATVPTRLRSSPSTLAIVLAQADSLDAAREVVAALEARASREAAHCRHTCSEPTRR